MFPISMDFRAWRRGLQNWRHRFVTRWLYLCSDLGIPLDGSKGASEHVRAITRALCEAGLAVSVLAARGRLPSDHPARQIDLLAGANATRMADLTREWISEHEKESGLAGRGRSEERRGGKGGRS